MVHIWMLHELGEREDYEVITWCTNVKILRKQLRSFFSRYFPFFSILLTILKCIETPWKISSLYLECIVQFAIVNTRHCVLDSGLSPICARGLVSMDVRQILCVVLQINSNCDNAQIGESLILHGIWFKFHGMFEKKRKISATHRSEFHAWDSHLTTFHSGTSSHSKNCVSKSQIHFNEIAVFDVFCSHNTSDIECIHHDCVNAVWIAPFQRYHVQWCVYENGVNTTSTDYKVK